MLFVCVSVFVMPMFYQACINNTFNISITSYKQVVEVIPLQRGGDPGRQGWRDLGRRASLRRLRGGGLRPGPREAEAEDDVGLVREHDFGAGPEPGAGPLLHDAPVDQHRVAAVGHEPGLSVGPVDLGWHYLSDATCLMRPRLFYASFVASRITTSCYILRHFC